MDVANIGVKARKTGLRVEDTGKRDEYGMESIDAYFASPAKSPKKTSVKQAPPRSATRSATRSVTRSANKPISRPNSSHRSPSRSLAASVTPSDSVARRLTFGSTNSSRNTPQSSAHSRGSKKSIFDLSDEEPEDPQGTTDYLDNNYGNESDFETAEEDNGHRQGTDEEDGENEEQEEEIEEEIEEMESEPQPVSRRSSARSKTQPRTKRPAAEPQERRSPAKSRQRKPTVPPTAPRTAPPTAPQPETPQETVRRSKRTRIAPLAFWRNERIIYNLDHATEENGVALPQIKTIVKVDTPEAPRPSRRPTARPKNSTKTKKPSSQRRRGHTGDASDGSGAELDEEEKETPAKAEELDMALIDEDELEWEQQGSLTADVFDYPDFEEKKPRTVAWKDEYVQFKDVKGSEFKLAILFDRNKEFCASGEIFMPPGGSKPVKASNDTYFIFYVVSGNVKVNISDTSFVARRGSSFEVPMGNYYMFQNVGRTDVRLFFVQTKFVILED